MRTLLRRTLLAATLLAALGGCPEKKKTDQPTADPSGTKSDPPATGPAVPATPTR